jgi:glycosyltransferase involved in cell wall biosynthesis
MAALTIVLSYYKAPENLRLILQALNKQSNMDFQLILAEDDHNPETSQNLEKLIPTLKFPLLHIDQEVDDGFRKTIMLNRAITLADTEKIAFIDGDCIPHRHFVKTYLNQIDQNSFCVGRSVMLDEKVSKIIKASSSFGALSVRRLLLSKSKKVKDGIYFPLFPLAIKTKGLVGRNWGCTRSKLLQVNGFDEDYNEAGVGEDSDIEWRLLEIGLKRKSVKNKAIVYHIYHKRWYNTEKVRHLLQIMEQKKQTHRHFCSNGIQKAG